MRQAWHIFKKDLRGLRGEVALLLTVAAALGWAETQLADPSWVELLAVLVANYAIARVIHNEAIPGHNQFWVTRPYRWTSLLTAKMLFILLCVQLPMLLAQVSMIVAREFPFAESLPGLIWAQLLLLLCAFVPVACLASLTADMTTFLFSEFIVVAMVFVGERLILMRKFSWLPAAQAGPEAEQWVRYSFAAVIIAGIAALVLFRQYRSRQTSANRAWGTTGIAAASIVFLLLPWPVALGLQIRLSKRGFDSSALSASLEPVKKSVFPVRGHDQIGLSEVVLPIMVRGFPPGVEAAADALFVTLAAPDGQQWSSGFVPAFVRPADSGAALINADIEVDPAFFETESNRPVTLHARLYLTLFGNARSLTIPIRQMPVNVMDGLQCAEGVFLEYQCRSIFRWPRRWVAASIATDSGSSVKSISYSPFPAELGFGSVEQHSFSVPYTASEVRITTKEPIGHFFAELTVPNVVLARFTQKEKRKSDHGVTGTE